MKMSEKIKSVFEKLESLLFTPHKCICCLRECDTDSKYRLCSRCQEKINFTKEHYCLTCGESIDEAYDFCLECKDSDYHFDFARTVFAYDEISSKIILRFKFEGYKTYAKPLAHLLANYYASSDILADCITFVPMLKEKEKERGFNQSKLLALELGKITGLPVIECLEKTHANKTQSLLSKKDRFKNVEGTFKLINKEYVKGKQVLIIDDVFTTGATTSECAKQIYKGKPMSVQVLTLAKRPSNHIKV